MLPSHFPDPVLHHSHSGEPSLRWGVLAPGKIATLFMSAMVEHTEQRPFAVASRTPEKAAAFAARFGMERSYGSYEQLVVDPDVDVVYVAAPQSEHLALGLLAIRAGKHVLIEKPLATTAADAQLMVDAARDAEVLLMEAMWDRYLPHTSVIRALLADGVLGPVRSVFADLSHAVPADPSHRLYRPELAGGALFDLGIYPVQFDSMILGRPNSLVARGGFTETGVDAYSTAILDHGDGVQSTLVTSLLARTPSRACVAGADAHVELAGPFHVPTTLTLGDKGHFGSAIHWEDPSGIKGFSGLSWEATALAGFVGEGRRESPFHTLDETVSIIKTLEDILGQLNADREK